jgi:hypothetical protein
MSSDQFNGWLAKLTGSRNPMSAFSPVSSAQAAETPSPLSGPKTPSLPMVGSTPQPTATGTQVNQQPAAAPTNVPQKPADPLADYSIKDLTGVNSDLTQKYLQTTDFSKMSREQNPNYWFALSEQNKSLSDMYAGWDDTKSAAFAQRATEQSNAAQKLIDAAINPQIDAMKTSIAKNILDSQKAYNDTRDEAVLGSQIAQQGSQSLDTIIDPKTGAIKFPTGPYAGQLHLLAAALKEGGANPDWVNKNLGTPEAFEELGKNVPNLAMETGRMGLDDKSPLRVTMLKLAQQGVPNAELLPQAIKYMVDNGIKPRAQQAMDTWKYIDDNHIDPTKYRVDSITDNYKLAHPWYHETQQASGQAPVPPGVKVQDTVIPAPIAAMGRPMQYNAQSGLYKDKQTGVIYNANGQVVKGNQ